MATLTASSRSATRLLNNVRIRHFTPNWFATTMGTGILAICLGQFPHSPLLVQMGGVLWLGNGALFVALAALYVAKWLLYPRDALRALEHPVVSMFFGCIPMGLATIVNGALIFGIPMFGAVAAQVAVYLWWIDAFLAVLAGLAIPYAMFTRQEHAFEHMSAIWLLPIVASGVTAASGGLLLPHIDGASAQLTVLFASYVLWACSLPLALSILTILFLRLALHKLPPASMAATAFLALGPIGTGALGLMLFAANGRSVLEANGLDAIAAAISGAALLGAILLWAYGLWWLGVAAAVTVRYLKIGLSFNLGWWAYTFPMGVYAVATLRLSTMIPVPALGVFGALLVVVLAATWLLVATRTALGALDGALFSDPCLEQ
ncbi:C4-dicarboxylate ABC transporter [Rhizobium sp. AC44/96]|uniref:TDT family transporter n=1 Tax=Rhizobium sp. AC44/96 TaxID=1841654 RepID=UPI00080FF1CA|nr:TDT family transporter [Rhizobium sp. AC44/96]OCJ10216.1 C4-dicarboxylate ABC transporter [Rhizobium sp. AC44/96]